MYMNLLPAVRVKGSHFVRWFPKQTRITLKDGTKLRTNERKRLKQKITDWLEETKTPHWLDYTPSDSSIIIVFGSQEDLSHFLLAFNDIRGMEIIEELK